MTDENSDDGVIPPHGRGVLRPWKPGQSGNPKGIPHYAREVTRLAKQSGPEVMRRLIEIATDTEQDPRASIVASGHVLDRAFGKAKDGPLHPDEKGAGLDLSHLTDAEAAELGAALATVRRLTGREVGPAPVVQIYIPDNGRDRPEGADVPRYDATGRRLV